MTLSCHSGKGKTIIIEKKNSGSKVERLPTKWQKAMGDIDGTVLYLGCGYESIHLSKLTESYTIKGNFTF